MMRRGIYKIRNIINQKLYVGSSIEIEERWPYHAWQLNKKCHHSIKLQRAWNKYGQKNFSFEMIEECSEADLIPREQYYLDVLNPFYNISKIAGKPPPPPNKPIIRTDPNTGKTKWYRTRDEAAFDGFNEGEITACCHGRGGSHAGFLWRFADEEQPKFDGILHASPVIRIDPNTMEKITYETMTIAVGENFSVSGISACCLGKIQTHGGYIWKYLNDTENHSGVVASRAKKQCNRAVAAISITNGERKIYQKVSDVESDGFSIGNVIACCTGKRKFHKGFYWQYLDSETGAPSPDNTKKVIRVGMLTGEEKEYASITHTKEDGFRPAKVGACCLGRRKTHGGYLWKHAPTYIYSKRR